MIRELEGDTLVVRIPMRFKRQGGRKRILAPDCSDLAPPARAQPDGTLVKALARARRSQRQLDGGIYASLAEIAAVEKLSPTSAKSHGWSCWRPTSWRRCSPGR